MKMSNREKKPRSVSGSKKNESCAKNKKQEDAPIRVTTVFNSFAPFAQNEPQFEEPESIILKLQVPFIDASDANPSEPTPFDLGTFDDMDVIDFQSVVTTNSEDQLRVVNLLKEFQTSGAQEGNGLGNKENPGWPESTNIFCYWCCHPFDTIPYGLPVKYYEDRFFVIGCYCSLECAMAYNNDSKSSLDEILERKNLINMLSSILKYKDIVKAAPNRLALKCFGGHMCLEEFRTFTGTRKLININIPPMVTLTQQIEEVNENDVNREFRFVPIDTDRINKYKEKIKIKRSKPVFDQKNTLDHVMKLSFE